MTDTREEIIEAMAKASYEVFYAPDKWDARHSEGWARNWRETARVAYEASPLERYRAALEEIWNAPDLGAAWDIVLGVIPGIAEAAHA